MWLHQLTGSGNAAFPGPVRKPGAKMTLRTGPDPIPAPERERSEQFSGVRAEKTGLRTAGRRSFPQRRRGPRKSDFEGRREDVAARTDPAAAPARRSPSRSRFQGFEFQASGEEVSIPRPRSADLRRTRPANRKSSFGRAGCPESGAVRRRRKRRRPAQSTIAFFANTTGWLNPAEIPVAPGDRDRQVRARSETQGPTGKETDDPAGPKRKRRPRVNGAALRQG